MTILLLFLGPLGPCFRVRTPFATQPQTERGCLLPLDFPRPPPWGWSHLQVLLETAAWQTETYTPVHSHTTDTRPASEPAVPASLPEVAVLPERVADLADGGDAVLQDLADLTALQTHVGVLARVLVSDNLPEGAR